MTHKTPLYDIHIQLGARIVDFHGWLMPIQYSGIIQEHNAVRQHAGLFDLSHMGEIEVSGPQSVAMLDHLICGNMNKLHRDGRIIYTGLLNEQGGFIDDLLVYRRSADTYLLVVNAANRQTDLAWIEQHAQNFDVHVTDRSLQTGLIALQGPRSREIISHIIDHDLSTLFYYHFIEDRILGAPVLVSRTGYTGEDGFEIYADNEHLPAIWKRLSKAGERYGLLPIGLGARDTLRLELRYPLHGNDIGPDRTPMEAGLSWIVDFQKEQFIGKQRLEEQKQHGTSRILIGFTMAERGIPRAGYTIYCENQAVGTVTSGTMSPTLSTAIGMGYVDIDAVTSGEVLSVAIHGTQRTIQIHKGPFVKSNTHRQK